MSTTATGNAAENAVAAELQRQGYKIRDQNWKTKFAEIDIVAEKARTLFFVEVKYRKTLAAGDGFDYITPTKLHHMQRAAESYILSCDWRGEYTLMVASVTGDFDKLKLDVVEI